MARAGSSKLFQPKSDSPTSLYCLALLNPTIPSYPAIYYPRLYGGRSPFQHPEDIFCYPLTPDVEHGNLSRSQELLRSPCGHFIHDPSPHILHSRVRSRAGIHFVAAISSMTGIPNVVRKLKGAARIILVGAPGVGKGTQSERLMRRYPQLASISTGDLLRDNVRDKTPIGRLILRQRLGHAD